MPSPSSPGPQAAGAFLALSICGGALIGGILGQSSAGLLAGLGVGVAACVVVWLRDRGRRGL